MSNRTGGRRISGRRRVTVACISLACVLGVPRIALGAEARPSTQGEAAEGEWYGWQTLTADGLSLGVVVASVPVGQAFIERNADGTTGGPPPIMWAMLAAGGAGYVLAPPVLHWVRGNTGRGFISLGMRVTGPLLSLGVTGCVGAHGAPGSGAACVVGIAGILGTIAASVIDATILARDPPRHDTAGSTSGFIARVTLAPLFVPLDSGPKREAPGFLAGVVVNGTL